MSHRQTISRAKLPLPRDAERGAWLALALLMTVAGATLLWLNRPGTLFNDELRMFGTSYVVDFPEWIEPWNGHLSVTSRVLYKGIFEVFGANYLVERILTVLTVLLTAGLFFAHAKRRVGSIAALAPTILLLFFGSSWKNLLVGTGITVLLTISAGLGALLALERRDLRGDLAACALITFSVASFSVGLAFLAGVIVAILLRPRWYRTAWVFSIPLLLYAAWWVWALRFDSPEAQGSTVLLIPFWILESLAAVSGGLLGVNVQFDLTLPLNLEVTMWGRAAALAFLAALVWRIWQGSLPRSFWVSLTVALVYWTLGGLVAGGDANRSPQAARYIYPGAVALLLVATDAFRGMRLSTRALGVLFGVVGLSLAGNLALLRAGSDYLQRYSWELGADLAMIEVARAVVPPDYTPSRAVVDGKSVIDAGTYLQSVGRFGSPAPALAEVRRMPARIRESADVALGRMYRPSVTPAPAARGARCRRLEGAPGKPVAFKAPPGSATLLRTGKGATAHIRLRRFGDLFSVGAGQVSPGASGTLSLPADAAPDPWQVQAVSNSRLVVCRM